MNEQNSKVVADLLTLNPSDALVFNGPFNRTVCTKLLISNPSKNSLVAFKMKTTSPRMFFVRPNIGMLAPTESIVVEIFLQPLSSEQGHKRHKFLILAAEASDDMSDLSGFWKNQNPEYVWDAKLKCELVAGISDDFIRQAGGAAANGAPRTDLDGEFELTPEATEPEAKLMKQVSSLEDERHQLKEEIKSMREPVDGKGTSSKGARPGQQQKMRKAGNQRRGGFYLLLICIFMVMAAIIGAYYGKHYL
ncbi:hypothetical protein KR018_008326 [Drosophila ironensis]|nr:hypothetical protein KR018_008326 [Drosophila ironensis]